MRLTELDVKDAAKTAAGNWRKFECFVWFRASDLKRPDDWTIIYTHNRDSCLIDQSNAAVIDKALEQFVGKDVVSESHSHWVVGHVDGFSIRVYRRGKITQAFQTYFQLLQQMDDYPILDETDYSDREYEATLENIPMAAWRLQRQYELPEGWEGDVYSWLSENRCSSLENTDDLGGYPDEEDLEAAFDALGYLRLELV